MLSRPAPKTTTTKSQYAKRHVQVVARGQRLRIDAVHPGDGDHRHHHVAEQGKSREASTESENERDASTELDHTAEHCEETSGMEMSRVREEECRLV